MMNRRDALKTISAATAAVALRPWTAAAAPDTGAPAPLFELLPLPYPADALEPHIDAETMNLHHSKHHAGYVRNLNAAIDRYPDLRSLTLEQLIGDLAAVPEDIRASVRNNGGGHANHTLFWNCLSPSGGEAPDGDLAAAIDRELGGLAQAKESLTKAAMSVFGSGWAWLSLDTTGALKVETTPNQDSPLMEGRQPLLGIDVWEHAYYLKRQNRRAEYIEAFWMVTDWGFISNRYEELRG